MRSDWLSAVLDVPVPVPTIVSLYTRLLLLLCLPLAAAPAERRNQRFLFHFSEWGRMRRVRYYSQHIILYYNWIDYCTSSALNPNSRWSMAPPCCSPRVYLVITAALSVLCNIPLLLLTLTHDSAVEQIELKEPMIREKKEEVKHPSDFIMPYT